MLTRDYKPNIQSEPAFVPNSRGVLTAILGTALLAAIAAHYLSN